MSNKDLGKDLDESADPFDLREEPFKPTPDPRFLYPGAAHRRTYLRLTDQLEQSEPVILLIGGPGMGKTTLLHQLAASLAEAGCQVLFPSYTRLCFVDLLQSCLELAELAPIVVKGDAEGRRFVEAVAEGGRLTVVLVDEAQVMADQDLISLCSMVEEQPEGPGQLKIVLAGQPELEGRLERASSEAARAAAKAHLALSGLDAEEVAAYVAHRLETAGGNPDLFQPAAVGRIAVLSGGVPRLINRLCSTGIFFAREEGEERVTAEIVEATIPLCLPEYAGSEGDLEDSEGADDPDVPSIAGLLLRAEEARSDKAARADQAQDEATEDQATADQDVEDQAPSAQETLFEETEPQAAEAQETADQEAAAQETGAPEPDAEELPSSDLAATLIVPAAAAPEATVPAPTAEEAVPPAAVSSKVLLAARQPRPRKRRYSGIAAGFLIGILMGGVGMVGYLVWPKDENGAWRSILDRRAGAEQVAQAPTEVSGEAATPDEPAALDKPTVVAGTTESQATETQAAPVPEVPSSPVLSAEDVAGQEDQPLALKLGLSAAAPEVVLAYDILLSGLPDDALLSAGVRQDDGAWRLASGDLADLTLTPPVNFSGPMALSAVLLPQSPDPAAEGAGADLPPKAFAVTLTGLADPPRLAVAPAAGLQGETLALSIEAEVRDQDGSETLELTISGLPEGARLSAGKPDSAGLWHLEMAQLPGLGLLAPVDFAAPLELTVVAVARESDGDWAEVTAALPVEIEPVLVPPTLRVAAASGREDEAIPLTIEILVDDPRVRERLFVVVKDLPAGAKLSAGKPLADGGWGLEPGELAELTLTPPANFAGSLVLAVEAGVKDAPETAVQAAIKIAVSARADWPQLQVTDVEGVEDSTVPLGIGALLSDRDGSETLRVRVAGLPKGAKLSAGKDEGDGRWRLNTEDLTDLQLLPPPGFAGVLSLAVSAVAQEAEGDSATAQAGMTVTIAAVADQPWLTVAASRGLEDTAIAADVSVLSLDPDGSETLTLSFMGLPPDARLSAGTRQEDGTWTLDSKALDGLTLQPPANFNGVMPLAVTVTAQEADGPTTDAQAEFMITVLATSDTPELAVAPASGPEDTAIPLEIEAAPADGEGPDTLALSVAGLPAAAALSGGTQQSEGVWQLSPADLDGLTLTPPPQFSGPLALTVTATAQAEAGEAAVVTRELAVVVAPQADAPTVTAEPATGPEDETLPLALSAALVDSDGSEALTLEIAALPDGASLSVGEAGEDGIWRLEPTALPDLRLQPPAHYSGRFTLDITAVARETTGETARRSTSLLVTLLAVVDPPLLQVANAEGREDEAIALQLASQLVDQDGSENLYVVLAGLPKGASLSAGEPLEEGVWRLTAGDLDALKLQPAKDFSGRFELEVQARSRETEGDPASVSAKVTVTVAAVPDVPTLTLGARHEGTEDSAIALPIQTAALDADGSESLSLTVGGLPEGWRLSAGTVEPEGVWRLKPDQLDGLTVRPGADVSGEAILTIMARATEPSGESAEVTRSTTIAVAALADAPSLVAADAEGREDEPLPLEIEAALGDRDGSESLSLSLAGLPAGASLSAGRPSEAGVWQLDVADLSDLALLPPAHFDGAFTLALTAQAIESGGDVAESRATLAVRIAGQADQPELRVLPAVGRQGDAIPLSVSAALVDDDGSETLTLEIAGLPLGAGLSSGQVEKGGIWRLAPGDLGELAFQPPADLSGNVVLTVTAVATEADGGARAASAPLTIEIEPLSVTPELVVSDASGREDEAISLAIAAAPGPDGQADDLAIVISGLPQNARLSAGSALESGAWRLTHEQLSGLALLPAADFSGSLSLTVTATTEDPAGDEATASAALTVAVAAVPDIPTLALGERHEGREDNTIALPIDAVAVDADGSESLSLTISGLPDGWSLSAGTPETEGTWRLKSGQLDGLTVQPAANVSGETTLTILAQATEPSGETAEATKSTTIAVAALADAPTLVTADAEGREDEPVPLAIEAVLSDSDGSESLSLSLSGLPAGASLSAGRLVEEDIWQLDGADLAGLTLLMPAHLDGAFILGLTAQASESGGDSAESRAELAVRVAGQADQPQLRVLPAAGRQGEAIPLSVSAALVDTDGSESLSLEIAGLPPGATLSRGQADKSGIWRLEPEDLGDLAFQAPADLSGSVVLTVAAVAREADGGARAASAPLAIEIEPVTVAPELVVSDASGREDEAVSLAIAAAPGPGGQVDGLAIVISGLPQDARLSAGSTLETGAWRLSPEELSGLTLLPAEDFSGQLDLTVTATAEGPAGDTATASAALTVDVQAVADQPQLYVGDARGPSGEAMDLAIKAGLSDLDGSESLIVEVAELPDGAGLSAGEATAAGKWRLELAQLPDLRLLPPDGFSGRFQLAVLARSREADGSEASSHAVLPVVVEESPSVMILGDEAVAAAVKVEILATAETLAAPMEGAFSAPVEQPAAQVLVAQAAESEAAAEWLARGDELLGLGDVSSARLFYELAADEGSLRAITAMGRTFDPQILRSLGVIGLPSDPGEARRLYKQAAEQGDAEAKELLKNLPSN